MHRRVHLLATNVGAQGRWGAVTSRHPRDTRVLSFKIQAMIQHWIDLATIAVGLRAACVGCSAVGAVCLRASRAVRSAV